MRPVAQRPKPRAIEIRVSIDLKSACRVLLTRARQRMVVFVPPGAKRDRTRSPAFFEGIYDYMLRTGVAGV